MHIFHILNHSLPLRSGYTFRTAAAILREQQRLGWGTFHLTGAKQGPVVFPVVTLQRRLDCRLFGNPTLPGLEGSWVARANPPLYCVSVGVVHDGTARTGRPDAVPALEHLSSMRR